GTAAAVVDAFDAGADGVRIGTRFVAAVEADAHPEYVCALVDATAADTEVTTTFGLGWPDAPHRVLRCSIERADALTADTAGTMDLGTARTPVPRFSPIPPSSDFEGSVEATALYAGMSCDAVTGAQPAAAIVSELIDGAAAIIAERS
ncbi:MAG: nitronate monooxygenase, partial [Acidimicrobiales bacterium]